MHRFDRVVIVDNGRVVADLPPTEVQACLDRGELDALSKSGRELVTELAQAPAVAAAAKGEGEGEGEVEGAWVSDGGCGPGARWCGGIGKRFVLV